MAEKPKSIYRVSDHADRTVVRVAAKSNAAARAYASKLLKVEKLSTAEIIKAAQAGYGIIDAESGTLLNAEEDDAPSVSANRVNQTDGE